MKKVLSLVLVVVMLTATLVACGGDSGLIGTWEASQDGISMTMTFEDGGKGTITTMGIECEMTWSDNDGKLTVAMSVMGMEQEVFTDAEYAVDGDTLTITVDGESTVLTRK